MYYIIKKQRNKPGSTFMGFSSPKYLANKHNDNVIFEFIKDGKTIRKWVKKEEIILLTADKNYFLQILKQFQKLEQEQQELVDEAHKVLEQSMKNFTEVMNDEIQNYEELRDSSDVPCILKDLC